MQGLETDLATAFSERISELRSFCNLRLDDSAQASCQQELVGLEASIKALETHVADIRAYLARESTTIPKVEALLEACSQQSEDIASMAAAASAATTRPQAPAAAAAPPVLANISNKQAAGEDTRRKKEALVIPRWYVTQTELDAVSSYMKGRLSVEKVNAAVDEIAAHAEANTRLVAAAQAGGQKLSLADRKRATELMHTVTGREGVRGRPWLLESDLKSGVVLKLDKSSKALLVLLRHLGRVQEQANRGSGLPPVMEEELLAVARSSPDNDGVLDWLSPLDPEFLSFPPALPLSPSGSVGQELDELASLPLLDDSSGGSSRPSMPASMRTAFSMNDLQSLQSTMSNAPQLPWAHSRSVSTRPALESVPECAPAALGPEAQYCRPEYSLYHETLDFLPEDGTQDETSVVSASAFTSLAPTFSSGTTVYSEVQQHLPQTMQQQQQAASMGPPVYGSAPAHVSQTAAPAPQPLVSPMGRPVRNRRPTKPPPGFVSEPPETLAMDSTAAMYEPGSDSATSGSAPAPPSHASYYPHAAQHWMPPPPMPMAPPSMPPASMRRSASALELGAWRKMASGDTDFMDCIDPSGSVREQLHGLDSVQIGKLTPQERLQKILRYRAKRQMRNFNRTIKYQCRKSLADTRPRVRGRFARDNEPGSVLPHETKKAMRAKGGNDAPASTESPPTPTAPAPAPMPSSLQPMMPPTGGVAMPTAVPTQVGPTHASMQPGQAAAAPMAPLAAATAPMGCTMMSEAQGFAMGAPETHAGTAALAHLYNQWSEVPMGTPMQV